MSEREDVQSLLRDPAIESDLRSVLDAASDHEPSSSDIASLGKRLAALLPPGTLPPAPAPYDGPTSPSPAPPVGAGSALAGKVIMALAIASAIGGAIWLVRTSEKAIPIAAAPSPSASDSASAAGPGSTVVVALDAAPAIVESGTPSRSHSTRVAPLASSPVLPVEPEASILARAHDALLQGSPDRALALAGEHARAYPRGILAQEREVIAIEALVNAGRNDDARTRASSFRAAYPSSSHRARVERLVEGL